MTASAGSGLVGLQMSGRRVDDSSESMWYNYPQLSKRGWITLNKYVEVRLEDLAGTDPAKWHTVRTFSGQSLVAGLGRFWH